MESETMTAAAITLRCPECGKTKPVPRMPHDPKAAVVSEVLCPRCGSDGDGLVYYFDAAGNEISLEQP
jgi:endogenous inhibitor of DNA gyrase (YacG/DUF329 family)